MNLQSVLVLSLLLSIVSTKTTFEKNGLTIVSENKGEYTIRQKISILLPGTISDIEDMRSLNLMFKEIVEIQPGALKNLPRLKRLLLAFNGIEKIEEGVFNSLPKLTHLDLSANQISSIVTTAFHNMSRLRVLNLDINKLASLDPHWFDSTPSLETIHISRNLLTEIPAQAFAGVRGPQPLSIFLNNNLINKINDDAFQGLQNIAILSLEENGFTNFSGCFLHDLKIRALFIGRNKIECIEDENFAKVFVADQTDAFGNPWNTECLEKMEKWNEKNNKRLITSELGLVS